MAVSKEAAFFDVKLWEHRNNSCAPFVYTNATVQNVTKGENES